MLTKPDLTKIGANAEAQTSAAALPDRYDRLLAVNSLTALFEAAAAVDRNPASPVNVILYRRPLPPSADFNTLAPAINIFGKEETPESGQWARFKLGELFTTRSYRHVARHIEKTQQDMEPLWPAARRSLKDFLTLSPRLPRPMADALRIIYNDCQSIARQNTAWTKEIRAANRETYRSSVIPLFHSDNVSWRLSCCYNNPTMEWLKNEDARQTGHNLYEKRDAAAIHRFQPGDIALHTGTANRRGVPPFIHRAPAHPDPDLIRLLMIADRLDIR